MIEIISNIDWYSVGVGVLSTASAAYGYWKLIPAKKKAAAKAKLKEGADSDGKLTPMEAIVAAIELL